MLAVATRFVGTGVTLSPAGSAVEEGTELLFVAAEVWAEVEDAGLVTRWDGPISETGELTCGEDPTSSLMNIAP